MNTMDTMASEINMERFSVGMEAMMSIAERYRADPEFRETVKTDPQRVFSENGIELPDYMEARVSCNTADTFYFVMPQDPNLSLSDEELSMIAGGGKVKAGSAGSVGTASSVASAPSCASSASSAGTAGTMAPGD